MDLEKLRTWLSVVVVIGACLIYISLLFAMLFTEHHGRYYNCTMSEISPDFPQQVKEACRNQRERV